MSNITIHQTVPVPDFDFVDLLDEDGTVLATWDNKGTMIHPKQTNQDADTSAATPK